MQELILASSSLGCLALAFVTGEIIVCRHTRRKQADAAGEPDDEQP